MKIVSVNKYFFVKGGSERSFISESELMRKKGHQEIPFSMKDKRNIGTNFENYFVSNVDYECKKFGHQISSVFKILYSFEAKRCIDRLICDTKPDLIHLHNIYHQISPSILHAIKRYRLPIVMTLHDYKVVCGSNAMFDNGKPCEACRDRRFYQCFLKECVKDSYMKSLVSMIEMYLHHTLLNIYDLVDVFISPSRFLKDKVEGMGLKGRIEYLPNVIHHEEYQPSYQWTDKLIVYFGRLSREKGIFTLIQGMKACPDIKLRIIGDGPLRESLELSVRRGGAQNIAFLGYKTGDELKMEIAKSMFVVLPSEWYENNPRTIIEAFALGKPVVGSRIGGIPELVKDGETGLTFEPGNALDIADKMRTLVSKPDLIVEMGKKARKVVELELSSEQHYTRLMAIYQQVMKKR